MISNSSDLNNVSILISLSYCLSLSYYKLTRLILLLLVDLKLSWVI